MAEEPSEIEQLLDRAKAGDQDALGRLLAAHHGRLRRMIDLRMDLRLKGRLDPTDVVQEACLEAAHRFPEYLDNPNLPFHLWIRFITRQKLDALWRHHLGAQARDARREVRGAKDGGTDSTTRAAADLMCQQTSPTGLARRAEDRERVQRALDSLDPLDREILILRHLEHLTNNEAAQELELQPAAASKRYVRALTRLRKQLKGFPGELMP